MQQILSQLLIATAVILLMACVGFSQNGSSRDAVRDRMIELLKYVEAGPEFARAERSYS